MIIVRHTETGTIQRVASLDGIDVQEWEALEEGAEPAELLAEARTMQWALVKAGRDAAEQGGCMTPFGAVQTDATSMTRLAGAVQMAALAKAADLPFSEFWTMADDSVVTLNADHMIGLGIAVGAHVSAVFARGRVLRGRIAEAETLAAIEAITWTLSDPA